MGEALAAVREGRPADADALRPALSPLELVRLELALAYRAGELERASDIAATLWYAAEVDATVAAVLVEAAYPQLAEPAAALLQRTTRDAALALEPHWQGLAGAPGDLGAWSAILAGLIATGLELDAVDGVARALAEGQGDFALWAMLVELLLGYRRRTALLAAVELGRRAFPQAPEAAATTALIFLGLGELEAASQAVAAIPARPLEHPLVQAARSALADAASREAPNPP